MAGDVVDLGCCVFKTKTDAKKHFSEMLNRYKPGEDINETDSAELTALIIRHHNSASKIGSGISHFLVIQAPYGKTCFAIARTDGTCADFSFGKCVDGVASSPFQQVLKAFRHVIDPFMVETRLDLMKMYNEKDGRVPCALTGELLLWKEAHLDHVYPKTFEKLVETFLLERKLAPEDIVLEQKGDISFGKTVKNQLLINEFYEFHKLNAELRLIRKEENLRMASPNRDRAHTWASNSKHKPTIPARGVNMPLGR